MNRLSALTLALLVAAGGCVAAPFPASAPVGHGEVRARSGVPRAREAAVKDSPRVREAVVKVIAPDGRVVSVVGTQAGRVPEAGRVSTRSRGRSSGREVVGVSVESAAGTERFGLHVGGIYELRLRPPFGIPEFVETSVERAEGRVLFAPRPDGALLVASGGGVSRVPAGWRAKIWVAGASAPVVVRNEGTGHGR